MMMIKETNRLRQRLMVVHSRAALLARTLVKAMDDFCETKNSLKLADKEKMTLFFLSTFNTSTIHITLNYVGGWMIDSD